jgi:hypothetical protein
MGKGSSVIMSRNYIIQDLDARYAKLIDKHGDFKVSIVMHNHSYFYHIIIPSESDRENTYDVVIQFVDDDKNYSNDRNIRRYIIKLFSNCPSFTFTYAYVYNEYNCLVPELQSKFNDDVLQNPPSTRNPGEIISFEKTTYFACKFLSNHKSMLDKTYINIHGSRNIRELIAKVRNTDTIMVEIGKEKSRLQRLNSGTKGPNKKISVKSNINKIAGVDKLTSDKVTLRGQRKVEAKSKIRPSNNKTNVIKPKKKITARKSNIKK